MSWKGLRWFERTNQLRWVEKDYVDLKELRWVEKDYDDFLKMNYDDLCAMIWKDYDNLKELRWFEKDFFENVRRKKRFLKHLVKYLYFFVLDIFRHIVLEKAN